MQASGPNLVALLGLLVVAWVLRNIIQCLRNPLSKIPGPWHANFTDLPLRFAVISGRRIHYVHALHKAYGPYVRIGPNEVAVNDAKGFSQIHGYKGGFEKSNWYLDASMLPRPVLFTMPSAQDHGRRRRVLARGFGKSNIRGSWESFVHGRVKLAVSQMRAEATRTGSIANVLKWWVLMANDVASTVMFGDSFHVLEQGEINDFIRTMMNTLKGSGIGYELPLLRSICRRLPIRAAKELFCPGDVLIDYAKLAVRNMRSAGGSKNVFATIQAEAEKGETLDDIDVESEALGLFIAGTDTTAVSLTYLVWAVLSRPILQRQVEEEVSTLHDGYQDADVEKLPLVNAVIEETLRLYGAAPGALPRMSPAGGIDMGGYYVPQGSVVTTHAYSAHRDPDLFPDPLKFEPSRWLPTDVYDHSLYTVTAEAKRAFAAFGGGARTCLGIHLAYTELRLGAAEFFRRCPGARLAPSTTDESMEMENYFLIAPRAHKCEVVLGQ